MWRPSSSPDPLISNALFSALYRRGSIASLGLVRSGKVSCRNDQHSRAGLQWLLQDEHRLLPVPSIALMLRPFTGLYIGLWRLACRLEPESKSTAADLKALIAEHEVAAPLQLPSVTMVVEAEGAQRSTSAEQLTSATSPAAELPQAQEHKQSEAKAAGAEPAASKAEVRGQAAQHPAIESMSDKMSQGAPIAAAVDSQSTAGRPTRSVQRALGEASPGPTREEQQAGSSLKIEHTSSAKAPQCKFAALPDAKSSQGSFLGKALSGASAKPRLPDSARLSTSQAQQIADAAAAGTVPPRHLGDQTVDSTAPYHSAAAAAASASKGLTARTLQAPKTSGCSLTEVDGANLSSEAYY